MQSLDGSSPPGRISRRSVAAALLLAPALAAPRLAVAQGEATPAPAASPTIIAIGTGEVPTTGVRRPGPLDAPPPVAQRRGVEPVAIQIDKIGVDAEIERRQVVDGVMQDPTGPWVVSWYENLGSPGEGRNVVMAGHIDYWNVGPSVFYSLASLQPGDTIRVTGKNGTVFTYAVVSSEQVDAANAPLDQIVGDTGKETLTLITCGGTFDYTNGHYLQRTVVRAARAPDQPAAAE